MFRKKPLRGVKAVIFTRRQFVEHRAFMNEEAKIFVVLDANRKDSFPTRRYRVTGLDLEPTHLKRHGVSIFTQRGSGLLRADLNCVGERLLLVEDLNGTCIEPVVRAIFVDPASGIEPGDRLRIICHCAPPLVAVFLCMLIRV